MVNQVFQRITIDGKDFVDIEPKPEYAPLFATMVTAQKVGSPESRRGHGNLYRNIDLGVPNEAR